jgi:hypothetical protein
MKNFTNKLARTLKTIEGTVIAGIDTTTSVKLTGGKKNPMQGKIEKVSIGQNIMLFVNGKGSSYETMVKKRLAEEGKDPETFKLSKRTWGERIPLTPLVLHKGNLYLETIFLKKPKNISYLLDGKPIDKNEIKGLPAPKNEGLQANLRNKVIIRTFKLESIKKFKCGSLSVL